MKTKNLFQLILFSAFTFCLTACSNEDDPKGHNPVKLMDVEGRTLELTFPPGTDHTYTITGGDGSYSMTCVPENVLEARMANRQTLMLKPLQTGKAIVEICDYSNNYFTLVVNISKYKERFAIVHRDVVVIGENLTAKEKQEIEEKALLTIPVTTDGSYEFTYNNELAPTGEVSLHTGSGKTLKTNFERQEVEGINGNRFRQYIIYLEEIKREFLFTRYYAPVHQRATEPIDYCLMEDITSTIKKEYPNTEKVYTQQVVSIY